VGLQGYDRWLATAAICGTLEKTNAFRLGGFIVIDATERLHPPLRHGDIVLRDWEVRDFEAYAHWMARGHAWQSLNGPYYPHPNEAQINGKLAVTRRRIQQGDWPEPRRELVIASAGGKLLGVVSRYWISEETNWLAVGLAIYNSNLWGRGIGFIALGLWTDYLFASELDLARLDLRTWSGNVGMMRLAGKLGFQEEARFRKARLVKGRYYDGLGYGMLREEWYERFPKGFANYQKA
jgi:RimJ/RimL family protein N-acetyltransferase